MRAQNYRILHLRAERDWLDAEASDFLTLRGPDGAEHQAGVRRAVFRPDIKPDVPLFFVAQGRDPYATEAFVHGMREAGITGLDFIAA